MSARTPGRRAATLWAALGAVILAGGCASQPSQGPNTQTGLPTHVDGGARQVLRFCETLHDNGELATAAAVCERAHRLDPSLPEPLLELASILGEMGETDLSIAAYRAVLKTAPENSMAHYGLGRIYLDQAQHDLALAAFQAALRGNDRDPRLYLALGVAQGLLGEHARAQETYRDGLHIAPNDIALRNNLALSLVQTGDYDKGVRILEALGKDPGVEQVTLENLQMAQGLAAAAHAEAALAEAARIEALMQAEAEAKAMAKAGVVGGAAAPAVTVSYPRHAWPMDGPGTDGPAPVATMAEKPEAGTTPRRLAARAPQATTSAAPQPKTPAQPAPVAAPTPLTPRPLTKAMIATPAPRQPAARQTQRPQTQASPAPTPSAPSASAGAPLAPPRPLGPQTARADTAGTSDAGAGSAGMSANGTGDAITWTVPREAVDDVPKATATARTQPQTQAQAPRQAAVAIPGGAYAVQFASYTSEDRAWRGWDTLRVEATDLLNGVEPKVERADLGGEKGVVYRLRTAPAAKSHAETLCAALKGQGINCLVVKSEPKMAAARSGGEPATL